MRVVEFNITELPLNPKDVCEIACESRNDYIGVYKSSVGGPLVCALKRAIQTSYPSWGEKEMVRVHV